MFTQTSLRSCLLPEPPFTVDCSISSVWSIIDLRPSELEEVSEQQIRVSQAKVVFESPFPFLQDLCNTWGLTQWLSSQESTYNEGSTPGSGRSPGGGNGTHSSTLAWKIPWMEEPGGLQSMGSLTVGHD